MLVPRGCLCTPDSKWSLASGHWPNGQCCWTSLAVTNPGCRSMVLPMTCWTIARSGTPRTVARNWPRRSAIRVDLSGLCSSNGNVMTVPCERLLVLQRFWPRTVAIFNIPLLNTATQISRETMTMCINGAYTPHNLLAITTQWA